ncbi:rCG41338 [Rattus norvegicus]|uniref:RCG41338 n=1 Tax=Rattus norvegicus TaxID=10116 RepID=A6IHR4_RAT|nr:rCG41338 [Rattus norvegicus]
MVLCEHGAGSRARGLVLINKVPSIAETRSEPGLARRGPISLKMKSQDFKH